jgi:hypothetical protein
MRPFLRNTVELPGPAPCQAPQLTILRLPQSVYISMIGPAGRISNEMYSHDLHRLWHDGAMTQLHTLVTYVPRTHTQAVLTAIGDAGAGQIGNYSHCSFVTAGTGRFTPQEGAAPFVGDVHKPTEVAEDRVECVVEEALLDAVVVALRAAHPYEEPALMSWPVDGWRGN